MGGQFPPAAERSKSRDQTLENECCFARSGDARDHSHAPHWNVRTERVHCVNGVCLQMDLSHCKQVFPGRLRSDLCICSAGQVGSDHRLFVLREFFHRAFRDHCTACRACVGAHLDHPICVGQHLCVVIDQHHCVAVRRQIIHDSGQTL